MAEPILVSAQAVPFPASSQTTLDRNSSISLPAPGQQIPQATGAKIRNADLNLGIFSPVNQNGSFEFDRVLKSGLLEKRTRKAKVWRPVYVVLRPGLLSIYRKPEESGLRHKIELSEITAVAVLKQKGKSKQAFAIFSPSRNYHFRLPKAKDAVKSFPLNLQAALRKAEEETRDWADMIRGEARLDKEEQDMLLGSPVGHPKNDFQQFESHLRRYKDHETLLSSSPEPGELTGPPLTTRDGIRVPGAIKPRQSSASRSHDVGYSTNDFGSCSDLSDAAGGLGMPRHYSSASLSQPEAPNPNGSSGRCPAIGTGNAVTTTQLRNISQTSIMNIQDEERVIHQGWLDCLRTKGHVRSWKRLWVVLRAKSLTFYKSSKEYKPTLILPISTIIDAVEIDPMSSRRRACLQIITEGRSFRLCADAEDDLAMWLGALKSILAKRKEAERLANRRVESF
ncbi:MAG: hypothetical protein M1829_004292 [Trizodia sp. TS-e1964]|nr:MAG: hypothetical protein M1829_004292 [Trizodia sp. TS-e1964]